MLEEEFIWTDICKIQANLITFLKEQNVCHDSVNCVYLFNCNVPIKIAPSNKKKTTEEEETKINSNLDFYHIYLLTKGISKMSTLHDSI